MGDDICIDFTKSFSGTFMLVKEKEFPKVERVVFNDPATVVMWSDKTKTVVKSRNEPFDPEKGLAMCFAKKALGNKGSYYETFKRWLPGEVASCYGSYSGASPSQPVVGTK